MQQGLLDMFITTIGEISAWSPDVTQILENYQQDKSTFMKGPCSHGRQSHMEI